MADHFSELAEKSPNYLMIVPRPGGWEKAFEVAGWAIVPFIKGGFEIYELLRKVGLPEVLVITPDRAANLQESGELELDMGGMINNVLFKRHPYRKTVYIQASEYNPYLLREKLAELARVMIAGGATSFELSVGGADTWKLVAEATAPIVAQANGAFRVSRRGATKITWSYKGEGNQSPCLPEGLVWYENEPEWQAVWESAAYHGAKHHKIQISQVASHEFSTHLAAKFQSAGFKLGGSFRTLSSSTLRFDIIFGNN
jgi:hypothetical protein